MLESSKRALSGCHGSGQGGKERAQADFTKRGKSVPQKTFNLPHDNTATPATLLEFVKVDAPERKSDFTQSIVAALRRRRDLGNQPFNSDVICQIRKYY